MCRDALLGRRSGRNWAELDAAGPSVAGPTLEGEVEPQITEWSELDQQAQA